MESWNFESRPTDIQGVDLLRARLAGKDCGAVGCDVDGLYPSHFPHPGGVYQACDHLDFVVGEPEAPGLGLHAQSVIDILAIGRDRPGGESASGELGPLLCFQIEGHELLKILSCC